MRTVGVRALKQNASAVVSEVAAGEVVTITDRGRPVAQLIPIGADRLATMLASGRARRAHRAMSDLGEPLEGQALSLVLAEMRDDERY